MTLNQLRTRLLSIGCAVAVAGVLAGCGASGMAGSTAGGASSAGTGSAGSSAPPTITGIATPKSVSVVTAN